MNLAALVASASLLASQGGTINTQTIHEHQKSAAYAQHSYGNEDLAGILKMAEASAATRPNYAIALYRRVMAENGPLAEKAVEGAMQIYNKRLPFKEYNKWEVQNALSFFDEIAQKHPKYAAEAYLKSGEILCDFLFWIPERIPESMLRLDMAYKLGDNSTKAKARFKQGVMQDLIDNKEKAIRYFREVTKLAPKSEEAQFARNFLETLSIKHFR